ncbi:1-pyrroline-5-carboxylate dehydrogenase [Aspergillus melleus]|uniref:1-pyrroline-5-carboxylate dehydrogenase n=1 Tax=Aspergillus melleus TaxID=138277 RepID=A0ACC3AZD3_9EURO|nr:1-pyrroline-5-carboxylate dehydrogenase [Aspergillus melleus]
MVFSRRIGALPRKSPASVPTRRSIGGLASFRVPPIREPNIPSSLTHTQGNSSAHSEPVAKFTQESTEQVNETIEKALQAIPAWENMSFNNRAAIFLRAAELVASKYRYDIMAATMLGQGKNIWQAEIDAAAETADFYRFNVHYASELYKQQNTMNDAGIPFNFTAIGANLIAALAIMGNVVIWKPSDYAVYAGYLQKKILEEAGLPENVIQFLPGDPKTATDTMLECPEFAALHYTGSTEIFRDLYGQIADGVRAGHYDSYPRIVGETGGKNFAVVHSSADMRNAVVNTVRGAFEYQGQKCSATSRLYVSESGRPEEFENLMGPVIHERSFAKLANVIDDAKKDPSVTLLAGGTTSRESGWLVHPTIFQVQDASHSLMKNEFFGPILSVYVYPDSQFEETLAQVNKGTKFGLTGLFFAKDRSAIEVAERLLRHSAGNFYINCKNSGAVVGHQPFGGSRASGTNDKAMSSNLVARFVSITSIKEDFSARRGGCLSF